MSPEISQLLDDLSWRGLVHSVTPDLATALNSGPLHVYYGCDPTAGSLHVGNLLGLITLRRLTEAGHHAIALAGGGTGLVGDPRSDSERPLLAIDEVKANTEAIRSQVEGFFERAEISSKSFTVVDNLDWLGSVKLMPFLRDIGKHFTVNSMLSKDSVSARIERDQGISFTEFSYQLLQAYDYLRLFDRFGCRLQIAGSDQWGNIVAGVDLIRRTRREAVHALVWPLIMVGDEKMGKSAGNAIWLDAHRTSPYHLFQSFLQTEDAVLGYMLRAYTFLSREEIECLDTATADTPERREGQRALAREIVTLVHGPTAAAQAERAGEVLFSGSITTLDEGTLLDVLSDAPSTTKSRSDLSVGLALVDLLVEVGLVRSKGAARTTIDQGGAYINNQRQSDPDRVVSAGDAMAGGCVLLRRGRREQHLLRFV